MTNKTEEKLSLLPPEARDAYLKWLKSGDEDCLDLLLSQLFTFHEVSDYDSIHAEKGDGMIILKDLPIDSLTLAEILFFAEDLLGFRISNEEVQRMQTIGDLKSYIRQHRSPVSTDDT